MRQLSTEHFLSHKEVFCLIFTLTPWLSLSSSLSSSYSSFMIPSFFHLPCTFVPGTGLGASCVLIPAAFVVLYITTPIVQKRKLKLREVKQHLKFTQQSALLLGVASRDLFDSKMLIPCF
jgi:hypothetical protein